MEKTLIDGANKEFIIHSRKVPQTEGYKSIIWENAEAGIAKMKVVVEEVRLIEQVDDKILTQVTLTTAEIKNLYNKIIEIEAEEAKPELWDF